MSCEYCTFGNGKIHVIYSDDEIVVGIKDTAAIPGQVTIFPRQHFTIMELVPDNILAKCAGMAKKVVAVVFESLEAKGTNLIIQNGISAGQKVPHFALEIMPRQDSDGLSLQWEPKPLAEDELDRLQKELKQAMETTPPQSTPTEEKLPETEKVSLEEKKDNYLLKTLRRRP